MHKITIHNVPLEGNDKLIEFANTAFSNSNFIVPNTHFNNPMYLDALVIINQTKGYKCFNYCLNSFIYSLNKELKKQDPNIKYVTKNNKPSISKSNLKYSLINLGLQAQHPDLILKGDLNTQLPEYLQVGLIANYFNKFKNLKDIETKAIKIEQKYPDLVSNFLDKKDYNYLTYLEQLLYTHDVLIHDKKWFSNYIENNDIVHLTIENKIQFINNLYYCLKIDALNYLFDSEDERNEFFIKNINKICNEFPEWKIIKEIILTLHDDLNILKDKDSLLNIINQSIYIEPNAINIDFIQ